MNALRKKIRTLIENYSTKDSYVYEYYNIDYYASDAKRKNITYACKEADTFADAKFPLLDEDIIEISIYAPFFLDIHGMSIMYKNGIVDYVVDGRKHFQSTKEVDEKHIEQIKKVRDYVFKAKTIPLNKKMKFLEILKRNNIAYNK
jgi:hypothetical protein